MTPGLPLAYEDRIGRTLEQFALRCCSPKKIISKVGLSIKKEKSLQRGCTGQKAPLVFPPKKSTSRNCRVGFEISLRKNLNNLALRV